MNYRIYIAFFINLLIICNASPNKSAPKEKTALLQANLLADEIIFDKQNNIINAKGNVDVRHQKQRLLSNLLTYNKTTNTMVAKGNVKFIDSQKNIFFGEFFQLSGDMKKGMANSITGILSDGSLVAANKLEKKDNKIHQLDQSVYSPCKLCRKSKEPPTWQIKSRHTIWDKNKDKIIHTDARLEIKGIPVIYTPYLSHYGPNAQRKSGFLSPTLGLSNDLGMIIGIPYYWAIASDKDLTLTPFYTRDASIAFLHYRQKFCSGSLNIEGSLTKNSLSQNTKKIKKLRGHLKASASWNINKNWRTGVEFNRVLDKTYLKKYKFLGYNNDLFFTSRLYGEGFFKKNYVLIEGVHFQDISETNNDDNIPFVTPSINIDFSTEPGWKNGIFFFSGNVLNIQRRKSYNVRRLIGALGWYSHTTSNIGVVSYIKFSLRNDLYHVSNFNKYSGTSFRYIPKIHMKFMYPLYKQLQGGRMIISPLIGCTVTKTGNNPSKIPNEDSSFTLFDDINMFSVNHIIGKDLIDSYSRINYGIQFTYYSQSLGNSSLFIGQSYNINRLSKKLTDLGILNKQSDYVIKCDLKYKDWLVLSNNTLLAKQSFNTKKNISLLQLGKPIFKIDTKYIKFSKEFTLNTLEQIEQKFSSQFTERWSAHVQHIRNLGKNNYTLSQEAGITYKDDCFTCKTTLSKSFFTHKDLKPNVTFLIQLSFKNLGDVEFSDKRDNLE